MVNKRAAVIADDVKRLRFVRQSLAAHEAASRRRASFLRRSPRIVLPAAVWDWYSAP